MQAILNRTSHVLQIAAALLPLIAFVASARADIYQWEYINPADPSQGKQQSTTLAPDGASVDAVPGADLSYRNLTMAYLIGADLPNASFYAATLTDADFTGANARGTSFGRYSYNVCGAMGNCIFFVGTGITPAQLYSTASYQAHDVTGIILNANDLTGANFAGQNLTNAHFLGATLTDADFTGAEIHGATFDRDSYSSIGGISLAQLYSTANYQAGDLSGINFRSNNFSGANFAGQNLTNASFYAANLTDADFTGADVRGADLGYYGITRAQLYSTASYQAGDLSRVNFQYNYLNGANFAGQNLTNASFLNAWLTGADFTGAEVRRANFGKYRGEGTGITLAQLYSTASYQARDLSGIGLGGNNLAGGNFAGQNLTNASFSNATLTGADFTHAEVRGASFGFTTLRGFILAQLYSTASYQAHDLSGINLQENDLTGGNFAGQNLMNASFSNATLTGTDVSGADVRGAFLYPSSTSDSITTNLIWYDGHIHGLELNGGRLLVVRDYDGNPTNLYGLPIPPVPVTVDEHLAMGPGGTLRMVFEADAWDSTISFASGIPVELGGTLELTFAADVNLANQVGRTFGLFDWTGVTPTGDFAVSSPYQWNLSNLYATGEVTLTAVPEASTLLLLSFALSAVVATRRSKQVIRIVAVTLPIVTFAASAHADIYQWEYINPADPSQGKQQSTTLAPDGAGVDAAPGADLAGRNLTMAYLTDADLTNANFYAATLTDADLTGADVRAASFARGCGLFCIVGSGVALDQLHSTASYQAHDLSGIDVSGNYLAGANFAGQNLANANFVGAELAGADFSGANVRGVDFSKHYFSLGQLGDVVLGGISPAQLYSTASYQAYDLTRIGLRYNDLTGANFTGQNLTNAVFARATLTGADFTDADVRGADFFFTGITLAQLYSTSSYKAGDLSGIRLAHANLSGGNFAGHNLTNADFEFAYFIAADTRGAIGLNLSNAYARNLIKPNGHINGLQLWDFYYLEDTLVVRDYDYHIPITIDQHFRVWPDGTLRMVFEADAWDSTISFAPGIPVTLGGTLELSFAADVNLAIQVGRTFDLFDWTGVDPTGALAISSPYAWDLSNLYTTGEVTLTAVPEPSVLFVLSFAMAALVATVRVRFSFNLGKGVNQ